MKTFVRTWTITAVAAGLALTAPRPAAGQHADDSTPTVEALVRRGREFVAPVDRLDGIRTLDVLADCEGPSGAFSTIVRSHRGGDVVFHQRYTYRTEDYLAGIHAGRAWQLDPDSTVVEAGEDLLAVLRSHEFILLALNPESRLTDPHTEGLGTFAAVPVTTVTFVDDTGNAVRIHYAVDDGRPVGLTFENPLSDGAATIEVEYGEWHRVDALNLPGRLTIAHGEERWDYRFTRVDVDTLTPADFEPQIAVKTWTVGLLEPTRS